MNEIKLKTHLKYFFNCLKIYKNEEKKKEKETNNSIIFSLINIDINLLRHNISYNYNYGLYTIYLYMFQKLNKIIHNRNKYQTFTKFESIQVSNVPIELYWYFLWLSVLCPFSLNVLILNKIIKWYNNTKTYIIHHNIPQILLTSYLVCNKFIYDHFISNLKIASCVFIEELNLLKTTFFREYWWLDFNFLIN